MQAGDVIEPVSAMDLTQRRLEFARITKITTEHESADITSIEVTPNLLR